MVSSFRARPLHGLCVLLACLLAALPQGFCARINLAAFGSHRISHDSINATTRTAINVTSHISAAAAAAHAAGPVDSSAIGLNSSRGQQFPGRPPRVFFLFLAVDKISNLDVWKAFFAPAPTDHYRAFVHCKLPECTAQVAGSPLVAVQTVPSYYCTDLVSPMQQLINYALASDGSGEGNSADKFAFVSDSTLPAKPFSQVYMTLGLRRGSDFCLFPAGEWADLPSSTGGIDIAVKHHQWLTLERGHAVKLQQAWAGGTMHDLMTRFQMNSKQYLWTNNSYGDFRNFGCLDEFWHMAALYGPLQNIDKDRDEVIQLSLFTGGPLHVSATAGWQGKCDTFVVWSKYLHAPGNNPFAQLHGALDPLSIPHSGNQARPGWWDTISTTGLSAIRHSSFLFVRKFIDNPRLVDGPSFLESYRSLVMT